jgi:hypothetical protein
MFLRDYRAFGLSSVNAIQHVQTTENKTLCALSLSLVPMPETHRAVSRKEDRGGADALAGADEE